ncbi:MAG: hypothetical protein FWD36_00295 [Treponema sp.]|nr:hypothetical protein [Treponema sp.]
MQRQVFSFEVNNTTVLGFDTGLNSRAFAQAKFAQAITESGLVIKGAGETSVTPWQASGVIEHAHGDGAEPTMVVWGPHFEGERLDLLLNENGQQDKALALINAWIQAILALAENLPAGTLALPGDSAAMFWPSAALIAANAVFVAPPSLAKRCMIPDNRYTHTDLEGIDSAAFSAAAMLYHVFAGTPPFSAADEAILRQDMREGHFLPVHLAVPGLDANLAALIQEALSAKSHGAAILKQFLIFFTTNQHEPARTKENEQAIGSYGLCGSWLNSSASFNRPVSEAERLAIEKEKSAFLKRKTAAIKTRRFVARNTAMLLISFAAIAAALLIAHSLIQNRAKLPTTAGMEPVQVIESYYNAFGQLDHQMMEACVVRKAGKSDINTVINLFVINRARLAYEMGTAPMIIAAPIWQEHGGGAVAYDVFGVTDLRITTNKEQGIKNKDAEELYFEADYVLWVPAQMGEIDEPALELRTLFDPESAEFRLPWSYHHADVLTLTRKKGTWRITNIQRTINH